MYWEDSREGKTSSGTRYVWKWFWKEPAHSGMLEEIQGKHIQGTAGEQQLGPVMHANAAPN